LLENETLHAEVAEINRFSSERRWDEVIAMVERAQARGLEPAARAFMEAVRQRTHAYQKFQSAIELANRGEFAGAVETLEAVLAGQPEPSVEKEARRILHEIGKHRRRSRVRR